MNNKRKMKKKYVAFDIQGMSWGVKTLSQLNFVEKGKKFN
jgi:hypothetical protein